MFHKCKLTELDKEVIIEISYNKKIYFTHKGSFNVIVQN